MAVTRLAFITVLELNEILNKSFTDDADTNLMINEASEKIDHDLMCRVQYAIDNDLLTERELDNVKLATAYQVDFIDKGYYDNEINCDCPCPTCLSPKARTYLIKTSLWSRFI